MGKNQYMEKNVRFYQKRKDNLLPFGFFNSIYRFIEKKKYF